MSCLITPLLFVDRSATVYTTNKSDLFNWGNYQIIKETNVYYETLWKLNQNSTLNQNHIINVMSNTHKPVAFPIFTLTAGKWDQNSSHRNTCCNCVHNGKKNWDFFFQKLQFNVRLNAFCPKLFADLFTTSIFYSVYFRQKKCIIAFVILPMFGKTVSILKGQQLNPLLRLFIF